MASMRLKLVGDNEFNFFDALKRVRNFDSLNYWSEKVQTKSYFQYDYSISFWKLK